jgi:hypothetical protein
LESFQWSPLPQVVSHKKILIVCLHYRKIKIDILNSGTGKSSKLCPADFIRSFKRCLLRCFTYFQSHPIGYSYTEFQIDVDDEDYAPIPDVAVVLKERGETDWNSSLPFMADLVVEIQSTDQSDQFMLKKATYFVDHGCRMVVVVYRKGIIEVLTPTNRQLLTTADTLDFNDILPGLSISIASIFPPATTK